MKNYIVIMASLLAIGHYLDIAIGSEKSKNFGSKLSSLLKKQLIDIIYEMCKFFIDIFDKIYGSKHRIVERTILKSLLFSYLILLAARLVLALFQMDVPFPELLMLIALGVPIATVLMLIALFENSGLNIIYKGDRSARVWNKASIKETVIALSMGMIGMALFAALTSYATNNIYGKYRIVAISFGGLLVLPNIMCVSLIPNRFLIINPLRSFISSLIFMIILSLIFPNAWTSFIMLVKDKGLIFLPYIAFNLYADTISLAETRWILQKSLKKNYLKILFFLFCDLLLSVAIYLIIPVLVNLNIYIFLKGIVFSGDMPWIGILFWTTFSTSIFFYIFVLVAILLKLLSLFNHLFNFVFLTFNITEHPARVFLVLFSIVYTICFFSYMLIKYFFI